jgi:hypothetical protein
VDDDPELYVFRFEESEARRAERARQREECRSRIRSDGRGADVGRRLRRQSAGEAEAVLDGFFVYRRRESDEICTCD